MKTPYKLMLSLALTFASVIAPSLTGRAGGGAAGSSLSAQTIGEAFYIYRNDGGFNAFFRDEVDSIAYSYYDLDSLLYDEIVTQLVYTPDSVYRIPLAAIDSVGFVQPEAEYKSEVMRMDGRWLPYVVALGDNTITFRNDTPAEFLPSVGQVMVAEIFEEPFSLGFSGRVVQKESSSDGIVFTVEEIALSDIYDHIVSVGVSSSYSGNEVKADGPRRIWGMNTDQGVRFPLPHMDATIGPFGISCDPLVVMKYIVCVGEKNLKDYVSVQVYTNLQGSVSMEVQRDNDYHPEPNWKFNVPVNTSIPGLYGRVRIGGFVRASGSVNISATLPFEVNGYSSFVKAEGQRSVRENVWTMERQTPEAEINLDGVVSTGVAIQLQFGIFHEKLASADITAYVGPQLSAHFSLSAEGLVDRTLYSSLKNSEVSLDFGAEVIPGYRFWGSEEHKELPLSLNLSYNINKWYIVPTFTDLGYENHGASGTLKGNIERNLLPKVSLGWVLYDEQDEVYKKEYFSQKYRKIEDWNNNGLEQQLSDLPSGQKFTAYPLVNLLGVEMRGDEGVDIDSDFPVTLSDFKVTKSQYQKNGFTNGGRTYDYSFNVSVTATLDADDTSDITDWGYAYLDDNGREALISLRSYGTTYTDTRYAYYRSGTPPFTCSLYGYVKYRGSDEPVYGEPHDYPLEYGEHSCPDANHPHMIDLGLPSGTKWACCNVGASSPEQYGNYFAWGETSPKSVYDWDTYKYGSSSDNVVNIGSDIAGTSYDAATVNWGAPWCLPSVAQIQELLYNCTSEWTTQNGVYGRKFTGPNGGTIFLPAAGSRSGGGLYDAGPGGFYWSSTLYESYPSHAFYLDFGSGGAYWSDYYRYYYGYFSCRGLGFTVRPVR